MRKKIIGLLLALLTFALCLLGACGFASEETLQISSITNELQPDGRTKVTIVYTDEEKLPDVFYIPQGKQGEQGEMGNGVKEILYTQDSATGKTKVTIIFTDTSMEKVEFYLDNGISVVGIESDTDAEGKYMKFVYSNGNKSDKIHIPSGLGIKSYVLDEEPEEEGLKAVLTFELDNGEKIEIKVPNSEKGDKGETGKGIDSIIAEDDLDACLYILTINYTDGTSERVTFNRPQETSAWHSGGTMPEDSLGKNGDYYFDTYHNEIFVKDGGKWRSVVDFNDDNQTYDVYFYWNDTELASEEHKEKYTLNRGEYFTTSGYRMPEPTRAGYKFLGWYDSRIIGATTGKFTTLTPIFSDLTLYAIWERVE